MINILLVLWELLKKNFRLLLRSKTSALIVILGPLFIIFLVGIAFSSTGLHSVRVGTYTESYTNISESIIDLMEDNDFVVWKYPSEESCIDAVKENNIHICTVFPADLDINFSVQRQVKFHVDYSKVNLVFMILSAISSEFKDKSSELSVEYTEILLEKLNDTISSINDNRGTLLSIIADGEDISVKVEGMQTDIKSMDLDFNITQIEAKVQENIDTIYEFKDKLDEAFISLNQATDDIRGVRTEINEEIEEIVEDLEGERDKLIEDVEDVKVVESAECGAGNDYECGVARGVLAVSDVFIGALDDYIILVGSTGDELSLSEGLFEMVTVKGDMRFLQATVDRSMADLRLIEQMIDDAKEKSAEAGITKNETLEELIDINNTLDMSLNKMENISNVLDDMNQNLENVTVVSAEAIVNPIKTRIEPVLKQKSYLDYTFPSLIVLIVMFISILLSSTSVMTERNSRAYFRNFITPVLDDLYLLGAYISNMLVVSIQILIIGLVGIFFFGIHFIPQTLDIQFVYYLLNILGAIAIISTVFVLLGMIVGYFFNSEETTTLASISMSAVLMLFSSVVIPIETMAVKVGRLAQYNPFVISSDVLQKLLLHRVSLPSVKKELIILGLYIIYLAILLHYVQRLSKQKLQ